YHQAKGGIKVLNLGFILISVCLGVLGQLSMKYGTNQIGAIDFAQPLQFLAQAFTNLYVLAGLTLYAISSVLWIITLSRVDLSFAYPLISLGYILILFLSALFLK
ncbi:hypothetical protein CO015_04585, partial [candidate division WWE3 bacterium CG_4_8_14_3_um_filter_42_11]